MTHHDAQSVDFNLILLGLFSSNFGLSFLEVVEEHAHQSRIFRYVHDVREFLLIEVGV